MKNMHKKLFLSVLVILLSLSLAGAYSTEIKVKTLPLHKVSIFVLDSNQVYYLLESFHRTSDISGETSVNSNTQVGEIDVMVRVTEEGSNTPKFIEKFEDYNAGKPISIRIDDEKVTGKYVPEAVVNESEQNSTDPLNVSVVETGEEGITGQVVSGAENSGKIKELWSGVSKYVYYIIAGLVLIAVVIFFARRGGMELPPHLSRSPGNSNSLSAIKDSVSNGKGFSSMYEKRFTNAERKLAEAQEEIRQIRTKKERLSEAEKRFEDAKKDLDKARADSY